MESVSKELFEFYEKSYKALKLILDTTFDEITIADENGKFLHVSSSCENNFARKIDKILGKTCYELEGEGVFSRSVTKSVLESHETTTIIQNTSGGKRLIVTGIPMFDDEKKLTGVVNISRDVTEVDRLNNKIKETQNLLGWYSEELKKRSGVERSEVVANSASMKIILDTVKQIADLDTTVLLTGDTGVGKGYISRVIHDIGSRHKEPFIQINCGAIPENLLESELFGYEKGAFTGANKNGKMGYFEVAQGGTILLDEIGEMPLKLQVKLLTVLEEKEAFRVGGLKPFKVKARIIAATNKDLRKLSEEGSFRKDLYYRLNIIPIYIPALKERPEDILILTKNFLNKFNEKYKTSKELSQEAYDALMHHDWPGNTRELENVVERLVISVDNPIIDISHIENILPVNNNFKLTIEEVVPLKKALNELEEKLLLKAYKEYKTSRRMAEVLEIDQSTVVRKLKKYGL